DLALSRLSTLSLHDALPISRANGSSGIFSPTYSTYPWPEVIADEDEPGLMMMTIDTREQRTGRRTTRSLEYAPGNMLGSLTGEQIGRDTSELQSPYELVCRL